MDRNRKVRNTNRFMNEFEKTIKRFLEDKAAKEEAFAKKYRDERKSIADCCRYIISEVKKKYRGKDAACSDEYVFGLAIHYYDEADLKVAGSTQARVVVSRQLTEAEKDEARKEAEIQYLKEKEDAVKRAKEEEVRKNLERLRKEEAKAEAAEKRKAAAIEKKKLQAQQEACLFLFEEEEE